MAGTMRWLYDRLGHRYVRWGLFVQFQVAFLVVAGAVVLLNSFVDLTATEFWRILLVTEGFVLIENAIAFWGASTYVRPADPWLSGEDRSQSSALAAWKALAALPRDFLLDRRALPVALTIVPLSVYVTYELGVPLWPSFFIIVAGAGIVLLYAAFLRFFGIELVVRPVLEAISDDLPNDARLGAATVSVRLRVLLGLPTINVISGVVIVALAAPDGGLSALGAGVLATLAVSFTLSLGMSLLLLRSIIEPIQDLREGTRRVMEGDLSVRVPVLGSDESGSLAGSFNQMVAGLEERRKLHSALEAYVAPELVPRVLEEGPELEPHDVEVTVMFLDIRNFTAFAEQATAREVIDRLNVFYGLVVPVVAAHRGHIDNFIGDGLLAVFGAPEYFESHADQAVAAAIEIADRVRDAYGDDLRIGIGVNTGNVVTGSIGGGGRFDFTVIGDAVNTAARVEEVTRMTGDVVLVTQATREALVTSALDFADRGEVELKGKVEKVLVSAPQVLNDQRAEPHLRSA